MRACVQAIKTLLKTRLGISDTQAVDIVSNLDLDGDGKGWSIPFQFEFECSRRCPVQTLLER